MKPPSAPGSAEVARFSFVRPGNNKVSVGPYVVDGDVLVVRGACRSVTGTLTWNVFDNSDEADSADEVKIVGSGAFTCDGTTQQATAEVGGLRDLALFGVTGSEPGQDDAESAWLTLSNE